MTENNFSKELIRQRQKQAQEQMEKNRDRLRKVIQEVASTDSGEELLRYLFFLCGGDSATLRRQKEGQIDLHETLATVAVKAIWENLRFNMDSDTIKKLERHQWEDIKN